MPTEESADRATKMYMNVEFEDCNLVVMRAWQRIPKGRKLKSGCCFFKLSMALWLEYKKLFQVYS